MYDIKNLKIWKESPADNPLLNRSVILEIDASFREVFMEKKSDFEKIRKIFSEADLTDVNRRPGAKFQFPLYLTAKMEATDIDALELSVRSYNCLKRAGYHTIGALVNSIHGSEDLKSIRNCGKKSVEEIMENLFCYQYSILDPEKKANYLARVIEMNLKE